MFDQLRRAVGDLEAVSHALDPNCLDGCAASALVEIAARGERICSAIKALGARRVEETNAWREGGHRSAAHWVAEATGETVASDLGLGRMASAEKDYVGRIMARRPALMAGDRPLLVGVRPADPSQRIRAGAHVLALGAAPTADNVRSTSLASDLT